jgi:DNA-binding MarR family transcriptional regulator
MDRKKPMEPLLSWKIKDVHYQIGHYLQTLLVSEGLHFGHPRILFIINSMSDASQTDLAKRLRITPASLAVSLKRLEKAGYVERSCDEADQRVNKIRLTERGNQVVETARKQMVLVNEALVAGFSAEEKQQLSTYLDRLAQNMTDMAAKVAIPDSKGTGSRRKTGGHPSPR